MATEAFRLQGIFESLGVNRVLQDLGRVGAAGRQVGASLNAGLGRLGKTVAGQAPGVVQFGQTVNQTFTTVNKVVTQTINNFNALPKPVKETTSALGGLKAAVTGIAIAQLGNQVKSVTGFIVKAAAEMQSYQIRLRQASKTQAEANAIFAKVSTYEAKTPFELPELVDGAIRLKAVGFAADEVTGKFGQLAQAGELSALTGGKRRIDDFINALSKIKGGKSEGFEVLQETVGLSIRKFKELGGPVDQTGQIILRTSRDIAAAQGAIRKFIQETTGFKLAEASSESLQGKFSSLSSEVFKTAAAFGESLVPALDKLIQLAGPVLKWLQNLSPATKQAVAAFGLIVSGVVTLGTALAPLAFTIYSLVKALGALGVGKFLVGAVQQIAAEVRFIGSLLGSLASSIASAFGSVFAGIGTVASGALAAILGVLATLGLATVSLNQQTAATEEVIQSAEKLNDTFKEGLEDVNKTTEALIKQGKTAKDIALELAATRAQINAGSAQSSGLSGQGVFGDLARFGSALNPFANNEGGGENETAIFNKGINLLRRQAKQKVALQGAEQKQAQGGGASPSGTEGQGLTTTQLQDEANLLEKQIQLGRISRAEAVQRLEALRESTKGNIEYAKQDLDLQVKIHEERKKLNQENLQDIEQRLAAEEAAGTATAARKLAFIDQEIAAQKKANLAEESASAVIPGRGRVSRESLAKLEELKNKRMELVRQEGEERRQLIQQQIAREEADQTLTAQRRVALLRAQQGTFTPQQLTTTEGKKAYQELENQVTTTNREIIRANQDAADEIKRISGDEFAARRTQLQRDVVEWRKSGVDRTTLHALEAQKRNQIDKEESAVRTKIVEEARQATLANQKGRSDLRVQDLEYRAGRGEITSGDIKGELQRQAQRDAQEAQSKTRTTIADLQASEDPGRVQKILTAQANLAEEKFRIEETLRQKIRDLDNQELARQKAEQGRVLEYQAERARAVLENTKRVFDRAQQGGRGGDGAALGRAVREQARTEEAVARQKAEQEMLTASANDKLTIQKKLDLDILAIRQKASDTLKEQLDTMKQQSGELQKQSGFSLGGVTDSEGNAVKSFDPLAEARVKDEASRADQAKKELARKTARDLEIAKAQQDRETEAAAKKAGIDLKTGKTSTPGKGGGNVSRVRSINAELEKLKGDKTAAGVAKADQLRAELQTISTESGATGPGVPDVTPLTTTPLPGAVKDAGAKDSKGLVAPKEGGGASGGPQLTGEATITVVLQYPDGSKKNQQGKLLLQPKASPYNDAVPTDRKGRIY